MPTKLNSLWVYPYIIVPYVSMIFCEEKVKLLSPTFAKVTPKPSHRLLRYPTAVGRVKARTCTDRLGTSKTGARAVEFAMTIIAPACTSFQAPSLPRASASEPSRGVALAALSRQPRASPLRRGLRVLLLRCLRRVRTLNLYSFTSPFIIFWIYSFYCILYFLFYFLNPCGAYLG